MNWALEFNNQAQCVVSDIKSHPLKKKIWGYLTNDFSNVIKQFNISFSQTNYLESKEFIKIASDIFREPFDRVKFNDLFKNHFLKYNTFEDGIYNPSFGEYTERKVKLLLGIYWNI